MATICLKSATGFGHIDAMNVLSLNPGSSSLKFALHSIQKPGADQCLLRGTLERLGTSEATLRIDDSPGVHTSKSVGAVKLTQAVRHAVESCQEHSRIEAIGCRVVHGGPNFSGPVLVDDAVLDEIKALSPLAPLHNARDVETIDSARKCLGDIPVVAVFDTAFHHALPAVAANYALPRELVELHSLRRYGFHGISYRYVAEHLRSIEGMKVDKLVACHLGNGASACAILNGVSIDTSMGMTPLEGLVMGTRCGDIDAGLILYLEREQHIHMRELDKMLNSESGLAGMSGLTGDVRELEKAEAEGNPFAKLALDVFAYRIAKYIGAYAVALEGLDAIAFTGGIGENSTLMRERICHRLAFLGVHLKTSDASSKPTESVARIDDGSQVSVWVVKADEERQIAKEAVDLLT